jgi:hypothetical protein
MRIVAPSAVAALAVAVEAAAQRHADMAATNQERT